VTSAGIKRLRIAVLSLGFAICSGAAAQTEPSILSGVVIDAATSTPIAEAVVAARSPALPGEQRAVTDADGAFEMTLLPAGTYSLVVTRSGFEPYSPAGLVVKGGRVRVRIALIPLPSPTAVTDSAVEFDPAMTAPAMISGPAPEYTPDAIERGIEGTMQVRCVVTVAGDVRACKVVKGLAFMNSAVVEALQRRKYKPALAQGKPVDVFYTFNIRLKLPSR
jgi:TonB family protein